MMVARFMVLFTGVFVLIPGHLAVETGPLSLKP